MVFRKQALDVQPLEMRRRVKEQLKRMGGIEYAKVNFSYIDKETGEESFVGCPELGNIQLIPDTPLPPGDIFTLGYDPAEARYSLYRIQINISSGSGKFNLVGTSSKNIREAAKMAYDFLKTNGRKIGIDRDLSSYDANVQVISLMQGKDARDLGVAFFVGLVSSLLSRTIAGGLVVLGDQHPRGPEPRGRPRRQAPRRHGFLGQADHDPHGKPEGFRHAARRGGRQDADRVLQRPGPGGLQGVGGGMMR